MAQETQQSDIVDEEWNEDWFDSDELGPCQNYVEFQDFIININKNSIDIGYRGPEYIENNYKIGEFIKCMCYLSNTPNEFYIFYEEKKFVFLSKKDSNIRIEIFDKVFDILSASLIRILKKSGEYLFINLENNKTVERNTLTDIEINEDHLDIYEGTIMPYVKYLTIDDYDFYVHDDRISVYTNSININNYGIGRFIKCTIYSDITSKFYIFRGETQFLFVSKKNDNFRIELFDMVFDILSSSLVRLLKTSDNDSEYLYINLVNNKTVDSSKFEITDYYSTKEVCVFNFNMIDKNKIIALINFKSQIDGTYYIDYTYTKLLDYPDPKNKNKTKYLIQTHDNIYYEFSDSEIIFDKINIIETIENLTNKD